VVPAAPAPVEPEPALLAASGGDPLELRGDDAVEVLEEAGLTDDVAAEAGLRPDELLDELVEDDTLFVGVDGRLGYVERLDVDPGEPSPLQLSDVAGLDPFELSSKPTSPRTLYLDVDGHETRNDGWNSFPGQSVIVSAPYDTDGDPATFSPAEQDDIREIFLRVAEDYAPFDVNVTTREPTASMLRRSSPTDRSYGQRMVVTPSNWLAPLEGPGILGVAFVGSFDSGSDSVAFVFTDGFAGGPKGRQVIAEAISHEAGHTFGLRHDGAAGGVEYYPGHGDWAPIMGLSINARVTQWSRGEYGGANNREDDVAEIVACTGAGPDDWPDGGATGRALTAPGAATGVIGVGDVDSIPVDVGPGPVTVTFRPTSPSPNLRAQVALVRADGTVLDRAEPSGPTGSVTFTVPGLAAGRYAVEVRPIGYLTASTGFTAYGSMGGYEVAVDAAPPSAVDVTGRGSATAVADRLSRTPVC
jgi:hypothetical protein